MGQYVYRFTPNPLTGLFDQVAIPNPNNPPPAQELSAVFNCDSSAAVGDLVAFSTTTPNFVDVLTSNTYNNLCMGPIKEKPTPTTARVLFFGLLEGPAFQLGGLTEGLAVFIGPTGKPTTLVPDDGNQARPFHRQIIGAAYGVDKIVFFQSGMKTKFT